jgi:hypothetical protein
VQIVLPIFFAAAFAGIVAPYGAYNALPYAAAPAVVAAAPAYSQYGVARTQHHSQDNYGNYNYGYSEPNGAKVETRHPDGTVTGSYS